MAKLRVKLVRGLAGKSEAQIKAVKSLGLKKLGQEVLLEDNPMVRGNICKAVHLLQVEEVKE
ncbi:50S ribosomal protein L30 [Hydrogenobacter sp. T-2]|uniref:50S ribosomal protein L30 n=1 Tax=Pampinifervens diazotrophicum TaxID=1632018 RepID=UPI002B25A0F2|nr:50S ribosomal protein L30 [Hydrogenobacter sp. T-2]WPM32409.1 50S ribosomal protein L30 [Hydrogenobacter sp. T-2]